MILDAVRCFFALTEFILFIIIKNVTKRLQKRGDKMRIWLKNIRKGLHMTQYSVAAMAGIKRPYYSFIESGKRRPSPQVAQKIAQIMHFDWTRFFIDK